MHRSFLTALLFLLSMSLLPLSGADPAPPGLSLQRPEGIDDATWERIKATHAARVQEYLNLLAQAEKNRPRPDRDTIATYLGKRDAATKAVSDHAAATLKSLPAVAAEHAMVGNYVFLWSEVSPRLSGAVRKVGKGDRAPSLAEVLAVVQPGDTVLLEEGEYLCRAFPGVRTDIAIIGRGAGQTTLTHCSVSTCQRVRFEGVKIDCDDSTSFNLRDASLHLRDCHVFNYNSGAGGSNAMFAVNSLVLVEGCTFEGLTGSAGRRGDRGGVAFDFRTFNVLYVRNTRFQNNAEIVRAGFPCTFDGCRSDGQLRYSYGVAVQGGPVWLRNNGVTIRDGKAAHEFVHATDDRAVVDYLLGERKDLDAAARRVADDCALYRHLPYWIRLMGHRSASIRSRAGERFAALTGQALERPRPESRVKPEDIARAIKDLDSDQFSTRNEAKKRLEEAGEAARASLENAAVGGSLERNQRVAEILVRIDAQAPRALLPWEAEFTRWMTWYEANRDRLHWDDSSKRYVLPK
jgi:hypothetical protein